MVNNIKLEKIFLREMVVIIVFVFLMVELIVGKNIVERVFVSCYDFVILYNLFFLLFICLILKDICFVSFLI